MYERFVLEANNHKKLNHASIVKLYEYFSVDDSNYLVLEYCPCDLDSYLKRKEGESLSEQEGSFIKFTIYLSTVDPCLTWERIIDVKRNSFSY